MACAIVFATQHDILISKHVLQKRLIYKVKKHLSTKASNHWDSLVVGIFQLPEPPTVWNRNLLTVEPLLFRILWTVVLSSKAAHISTSFDCNQRCVINEGFCTMHKIFWNKIRKLLIGSSLKPFWGIGLPSPLAPWVAMPVIDQLIWTLVQ